MTGERTLGLLGGTSWESTAEYYRVANEVVHEREGEPRSCRLVVVSGDVARIADLQTAGDWDEIGRLLAGDARRLEAAGVDVVMICDTPLHRVADQVSQATSATFVHIGDVIGRAVVEAGLGTVGLLGTRDTMEHSFLAERIASHGPRVITPDDSDRDRVQRIIDAGLPRGSLTDGARRSLGEIIQRLVAQGAEGIVLGSTELASVLRPASAAGRVPLFPATQLHVTAGVDAAKRTPAARRVLDPGRGVGRTGLVPMLVVAALAGLAVRLPFGRSMDEEGTPLLQLAFSGTGLALALALWFWWSRRTISRGSALVVLGVSALGLLSHLLYPWSEGSNTQILSLIHLPIVWALLVGVAYVGRGWTAGETRLDYLRFFGEWLLTSVLLALGGGVLVGLGAPLLDLMGVQVEPIIAWVVPLGAGGATVVAAWLAATRGQGLQNLAPVLSAVFTPLFILLMAGCLVAMTVTGQVGVDRDVLILIDLLLAVVWGLVVFAVAARRPGPPRTTDWMQLALVVVTVAVDLVVLGAIVGRISEYGASPNKVAALGENLVLLVNLVGSAWLLGGFLRGRRPAIDLARWQGRYLAVLAAWAGCVVLVLPVVFSFA